MDRFQQKWAPSWVPRKNVFICKQHFETSSYKILAILHPKRLYLKPDAVPSIMEVSPIVVDGNEPRRIILCFWQGERKYNRYEIATDIKDLVFYSKARDFGQFIWVRLPQTDTIESELIEEVSKVTFGDSYLECVAAEEHLSASNETLNKSIADGNERTEEIDDNHLKISSTRKKYFLFFFHVVYIKC